MGLSVTEAQIAKPAAQKVRLELAIYQRYNRKGALFVRRNEQGQEMQYEFTAEQAAVLLREVDESTGRPIWRRPLNRNRQEIRRVEELSKPRVMDVSAGDIKEIQADDAAEIGLQRAEDKAEGRIDVGDESEIQDILDAADQSVVVAGDNLAPIQGEAVVRV